MGIPYLAAFLRATVQGTVLVTGLVQPDRVLVADGSELALYGLNTPAALEAPLDAQLRARVQGEWELTPHSEWRPTPAGDGQYVTTFELTRDERSLNRQLVREGLALAALTARSTPGLEGYLRAARAAQIEGLGLWSARRRPPSLSEPITWPMRLAPPAPIAGVALSMHSREADYDYRRELEEIRALGASWVNLIVATRQSLVDSSQIRFDAGFTPSAERIRATIASARELGLEVLLLPIVLIEHPGPDDWRGKLEPADRGAWWQSYNRMLCSMADVAAEAGASALSVGSELASREGDTEAWERVIANVRCRFPGLLTYSANWDHTATLEFWPALDFAGMTAYFELAPGNSPPRKSLDAGWRIAAREVERLQKYSGLPVVLIEIGLPSQVGAAATPWDYTRTAPVDLEIQERVFEAFESVFLADGKRSPGFHGVFLYDWWGWGGADDGSYTARGKPAEKVWRSLLAALR